LRVRVTVDEPTHPDAVSVVRNASWSIDSDDGAIEIDDDDISFSDVSLERVTS
jgi:hypothetical protein